MLRRLLSHHEIATLLVLLHAPIGANAKPELPALQEAGLVEMVKLDTETAPSFRLTEDGTAVLKATAEPPFSSLSVFPHHPDSQRLAGLSASRARSCSINRYSVGVTPTVVNWRVNARSV